MLEGVPPPLFKHYVLIYLYRSHITNVVTNEFSSCKTDSSQTSIILELSYHQQHNMNAFEINHVVKL